MYVKGWCLYSQNTDTSLFFWPGKAVGKPKGVPGWNNETECLKQQALFWHKIWKENRSPPSGILYDIRNTTRAKYHHAVRAALQKDVHRKNAMAKAFSSNNRDFWIEGKRWKENKCNTAKVIDSQVGDENISLIFADKYKELYNCVSYEDHDMNTVKTEIQKTIDSGKVKCPYKAIFRARTYNRMTFLVRR